jgi:regulator of protease activity HflC (stomatin/prohibitin superfamily)
MRRADGSVTGDGRLIARGGVAACAVVFVIFTLISIVHAVDAGHVGIIKTFGNITGQTGAGLVTTWPFQDLDTATIQVQRYNDGNLTSATKDIQNVHASVTINYHVSPQDVQKLYINVGPNYLDTLIPPRLLDLFKAETVKYVADDPGLSDPKNAADPNYKSVGMLQNRETIRTNVRQQLREALQPYSISVDDLLINDIGFDSAFTKAIEDKQVAQQNALAEQNKVALSRAKGDQAAAEAAGQSNAITTINSALAASPSYIQYLEAQKFSQSWDGHLPQVVGSGQALITVPSTAPSR